MSGLWTKIPTGGFPMAPADWEPKEDSLGPSCTYRGMKIVVDPSLSDTIEFRDPHTGAILGIIKLGN